MVPSGYLEYRSSLPRGMESQNVSRLFLDIENGYSSSHAQSTGQEQKKVKIVRSFHGLFYHNSGSQSRPRERPPKHNTATTSLCMTCCTGGEQLFAWQTAYPDTTIDVMNEKSGFIPPGNFLPLIYGSVSMFTGPL
ncbi:hypothetical protein AVEN_108962-1 [Araneus ventricosus]|uniref:Uncharacterized protein n=1 Tax=Araneus ventricosus TaxID=182803 RepID=A0A4Y2F6R2_ARAVE|nr:hypothetical protein AVEN_108962-1 [Araneus ventricosus]